MKLKKRIGPEFEGLSFAGPIQRKRMSSFVEPKEVSMSQKNNQLTYRQNLAIFKFLLWIQLYLLKMLLVIAGLISLHPG